MISYTNDYLHQHTAELQKMAEQLPVLISDNGRKQVLMDYEYYKKLAGENADQPFISAYDAFMEMMSSFSEEEQEALANADIEFDMSFLEKA